MFVFKNGSGQRQRATWTISTENKKEKTNEEKQVCISTYKFEHLNLKNSFLILRCGVKTVLVCEERVMFKSMCLFVRSFNHLLLDRPCLHEPTLYLKQKISINNLHYGGVWQKVDSYLYLGQVGFHVGLQNP